jgi:alpha-D-ribose 1-methylphosphonate 5-triphosphate synthase subunit PhnH
VTGGDETNAVMNPALTAQAAFRAILEATASPGSVRPLVAAASAPAPLSGAAAALALTLCDQDTPVWLDADLRASEAVCAWLRFRCGCRLVDQADAAAFAFVAAPAAMPPFAHFCLGAPDYPDRSTTIVLQVETLRQGPPLVLTGPGIRERATLRAAPLPADMAARLADNRALFPRGVDLILVSADGIAALPRSVRLAEDRE